MITRGFKREGVVKSGGEVVCSINFDRISPPKIIARFLVLYEKSLWREIAVTESDHFEGIFFFSFFKSFGVVFVGSTRVCSN